MGGLNIGAQLGATQGTCITWSVSRCFSSRATDMGTSGSFYEGLTDEEKAEVDSIYGQRELCKDIILYQCLVKERLERLIQE